jgi:uncharacterized membrane protein YcfT
MRSQIIQRLSDYVPHFDAIEILTLAVGVLLVVAVAFVLWRWRDCDAPFRDWKVASRAACFAVMTQLCVNEVIE